MRIRSSMLAGMRLSDGGKVSVNRTPPAELLAGTPLGGAAQASGRMHPDLCRGMMPPLVTVELADGRTRNASIDCKTLTVTITDADIAAAVKPAPDVTPPASPAPPPPRP